MTPFDQDPFGLVFYSILVILTLIAMFRMVIRQLSNDEYADFAVTFVGWTLLSTSAVVLIFYV